MPAEPIIIDMNRCKVFLPDGTDVALTSSMLMIAAGMARRPGVVFNHDRIIAMYHKREHAVTYSTISSQIKRLRLLVGREMILSHRGQGYAWNEKHPAQIIKRDME